MKAVTWAIVAAGIALAVLSGIAQGFDATSVTILLAIVVVGMLAIAAVGRWTRGTTGPATCGECGGVISPNAPYCKHCGSAAGNAPAARPADINKRL